MTDSKYNGWKNYETWCVNLWLDNDGMYDGFKYHFKNSNPDDKEREVSALAEQLKDYVEENNPLSDKCSFYADMMNAALSEVDYYEIAECILEEYCQKD